MAELQLQSKIDVSGFLTGIAQMPLSELEHVMHELNALIMRRKTQDVAYQEKVLLSKINQTGLSKSKAERYVELMEKLEPDTISEAEHKEFMDLVTEEEALRNERVKYLIELSQLKNIPLLKLMDNLGLNTMNNG